MPQLKLQDATEINLNVVDTNSQSKTDKSQQKPFELTKVQWTYMWIWISMTCVIWIIWIVLVATNVPCDNPTTSENYSLSKYQGTWYEIKRTNTITFEGGDCTTAQYLPLADGGI